MRRIGRAGAVNEKYNVLNDDSIFTYRQKGTLVKSLAELGLIDGSLPIVHGNDFDSSTQDPSTDFKAGYFVKGTVQYNLVVKRSSMDVRLTTNIDEDSSYVIQTSTLFEAPADGTKEYTQTAEINTFELNGWLYSGGNQILKIYFDTPTSGSLEGDMTFNYDFLYAVRPV